MIPSDIRLYTWVDVEEVLYRTQERGWPEWLVYAKAYWDNLILGIRPNGKEKAIKWLSDEFEPRFECNDSIEILLESLEDGEKERRLSVVFEETDEEPLHPRFIPTFARPAVLWPIGKKEALPPLSEEAPPIIAFHSFKGGVGRTLHALALAKAITKNSNSRILLVDGDLEAPGLTWLLFTWLPEPPVSYVDFLGLVHSDINPSRSESIKLVADRVKGILIDGIYVLPAFRSIGQFDSIEIKPDHLIRGSKDPFILTNILIKLGKELNVDAVIVDLRAGLSELSAGLLFDPRVYRILVTTLSSQSLEGTCQLLKLLSKWSNKVDGEHLPFLIISQVPKNYQETELLDPFLLRLDEASSPLWKKEDRELEKEDSLPKSISYFDPNLLVLPESWDDVNNFIDGSPIKETIAKLLEWLPGSTIKKDLQEIPEFELEEIVAKRKLLADFVEMRVYAEEGEIQEFMTIRPLGRLAQDFGTKVPIAIIIGAKGSGKTYTFLRLAYRQSWKIFAQETAKHSDLIDAFIYPALWSKNLKERAKKIIKTSQKNTTDGLGLPDPCNMQQISDYIRDCLRQELHEGEWRDRWLNVLAWGAGFNIGDPDSGQRFADYLREKKQRVIAIIDGLEDIFQQISSKENEQIALRALLQEVPEWLEQQPHRPIGLLAFIRQDMVLYAIKQNPAQLMKKYEPYSLKWSTEEALRLIAWMWTKSKGENTSKSDQELQDMSKDDLMIELIPLWGKKLGKYNSKEAHSAEWIITALSDLKGQIQARDVVRFLNKSAQASTKDKHWKDRWLAPTQIRESLVECSKEKISEIEQENESLKKLFTKLKSLDKDSRHIPFAREDVKLKVNDLMILENNGVVFRDKEEYYMPEIFRLGLGFKYKAGGRARVLTLARRAQKWSF